MLSILLLAHNGQDLTAKCLQAISDSNIDFDYEVILIDNASTDETPALPGEFESKIPNLRYLYFDQNYSFAIVNNMAAQKSRGKWLCFLNNDAFAWENCFNHLIETMKSDKRVGVTGARLIFPEGNVIQHAGIVQMLWGTVFHYGVYADASDPRMNKMYKPPAVLGAMLCIERNLFDQVKGFDENYLWGYEDVDLCLKAWEAGREVLYVPEATAYHYESISVKKTKVNVHHKNNIAYYWKRWKYVLEPKAQEYIEKLKKEKIKSLAIYGAGQAAHSLYNILVANGFSVPCFVTNEVENENNRIFNKPLITHQDLSEYSFDKVIVASQHFHKIEKRLSTANLTEDILFPITW